MDFLDFLGADGDAAAAAAGSDSDCDDSPAAARPAGPSALAVSLARLRQNLSPDAYTQLDAQGFLVLDNVFEQQLEKQQQRRRQVDRCASRPVHAGSSSWQVEGKK